MATVTKDRLITVDEACDRLALNVKDRTRTVRAMGRRGEIQVRYVGKFIRVVESSVDKIIGGKS